METTNRSRNEQKNYDTGYRHGYNGRELRVELAAYPGYADGWDAGHCDRPSLDELLPLDRAKEAGRWYV